MRFHPFSEALDAYAHLFCGAPMEFSTADRSSKTLLAIVRPTECGQYWHAQRITSDLVSEEFRRPAKKEFVAYTLSEWGIPPDKGMWRTVDSKSENWNPSAAEPDTRTSAQKRDVVYFLRAGPFIKIGFTGSPLHERIACLKTGCPYEISVLGLMPGSIEKEHELHRRFAPHRASGEWFHAHDAILQFIHEEVAS